MTATLAFDVYGTLIDTHGLVSMLEEMIGDKAMNFSQTWREKQLEYSFRRGLMQNYEHFGVCTEQALQYTDALYQSSLSDKQQQNLLDSYRTLPAFNEVENSLGRLRDDGYRMYAFSNGSADMVETLLAAAGIRDYFLDVVSVDDLKSYKPNPAVYSYFLRRSNTTSESVWLISSNPFDVIGARSAGMHAAWVKRSTGAVFDPWGIDPTITVTSLAELPAQLSAS